MSVTLKDIAKIAGVNPSTVSRSLNGSDLVASETKQKIRKIADDLGFEFNSNARSLMTKKRGIVGVIYPKNYDSFDVFQYYMILNNELRKQLEENDIDLIVSILENKSTKKNNIIRLVNQQKLDGLLIADTDVDADTLKFLKRSKIPFVFFHELIDSDLNDVDGFYVDHVKGGYMACKHLLDLGCKNIITINSTGTQFDLRTEGYKKALEEQGIKFNENMVYNGKQNFAVTSELVKNNLEKFKKADGIFAQNDLMAFAVIEALKLSGMRIPEDVRVVGYDDIEISRYISPKLTTVHQPIKEMSISACKRLLELIQNREVVPKKNNKNVFTPKLVIRDSCGANGAL